ncbi:hypothetical protein DZB84_20885 [Bacillus sp. HNG]|uniref:hypothetical protein n=1 Tax=Bacillus sp. HNG TaxID=2293325 RepID=UPI000E2F38D1|nr:hypothetical protein [Bacillus sp. HNG]RFB11390.1 hypothetical protein DZB84_20885 [Bacillus sp. HNG]
MNYMQLLSSLLNRWGGKKSMKLFKRKQNNKGWIWISILGVAILSIFGSRNSRVNQEVQKRFQQATNSFQSSSKIRRNPFDVNFDIATEIAKEIKPEFETQTQLEKNK